MAKEKEHVIWSDEINSEEWTNEDGTQMSYEEAQELNGQYLEDERMNLDKETTGEIVCMGTIHLWNGPHTGHQFVGSNIKDILYSRMNCDSQNCWYDDGKDIVHQECHHDGTNRYIYRIVEGEDHEERERKIEKLFQGRLTPQRIGRYTKSLRPAIAEIYGW